MPKITKARGGHSRLDGTHQLAPANIPETAEGPQPAAVPERPRAKDRLDVWQEYATTVGVDPTGLTKRQLIAAI